MHSLPVPRRLVVASTTYGGWLCGELDFLRNPAGQSFVERTRATNVPFFHRVPPYFGFVRLLARNADLTIDPEVRTLVTRRLLRTYGAQRHAASYKPV
jgi:hypothetical protein